jgi:hypothetical protein
MGAMRVTAAATTAVANTLSRTPFIVEFLASRLGRICVFAGDAIASRIRPPPKIVTKNL